MAQVFLFLKVMFIRNREAQLYINTLLPCGAAIAGKLTGKKVIYHIHESYIQPPALKRMLRRIAAWSADSAVYVSNYLLEAEQLPGVRNMVIYNALSDDFASRAGMHHPSKENFMVLMVSSLKEYKGINHFVALAEKMKELNFELVLNAKLEDIIKYFKDTHIPFNLAIHPAQSDVHPFYERASLVVNLSVPDLCIETFGMTLLEGMCYGIPVIGPPAGGPLEVVMDGINGFSIDVRNSDEMQQSITEMASNKELHHRLSLGAKATASAFEEATLHRSVNEILKEN